MKKIHPSAKTNFNNKSLEVLNAIVKKQVLVKNQKHNNNLVDIYPQYNIPFDSIIPKTLKNYEIDSDGNKTGFYFNFDDELVGLNGTSYELMCNIVDRIKNLEPFKETLSLKFIKACFEDWLINQYKTNIEPIPFITFLTENAKKNIKDQTIIVPISKLVVNKDIVLGNTTIKPFSRHWYQELKNKTSKDKKGKDKDDLDVFFKKLKNKHVGYAVMEYKCKSEPELATEKAFQEAERSINLLGIFSRHILSPNTKSHCRVYGSDNFESVCCLELSNCQEVISYSTIAVGNDSQGTIWQLDNEEFELCQKMNFNIVSKLLIADSLSEYKQRVLNSLLIYSRAAFTADPMEKLIFTLSSLESFLLKNKSEPIQQNLADRFAFYLTEDSEYRISIVNKVKSIYSIRSDYLHHGLSSTETYELKYFLKTTFDFYYVVLSNIDKFKSKESFFNYIDKLKYQ